MEKLEMDTLNLNIRIGKQEIDRILNLKAEVDDHEVWQDYANRCLGLGWALLAIDGKTGDDLGLDFEDADSWEKRLKFSIGNLPKLNLGVKTGCLSRLLVVEVVSEEQKFCLDEWGEWRSLCVAELGAGHEKHFYLLPRDFQPLWSIIGNSEIRVYAEGDTTLLPPSQDPFTKECWQWQTPPWDHAPSPVPLSVMNFLQGPAAPGYDLENKPTVSWRELYCRISPFETVLQAFARHEASIEEYYEKLIGAAEESGLTESDVLLSLLWYAPLGDARQRPERWADLQTMLGRSRLATSPKASKPLQQARTQQLYKRAPINFPGKGTVERRPLSKAAGKNG
jgi:hypothetical protein